MPPILGAVTGDKVVLKNTSASGGTLEEKL